MEMPDELYAKEENGVVTYSAVNTEDEDAVEYIRADKILIKLVELLYSLKAKDELIFDKMKELLE